MSVLRECGGGAGAIATSGCIEGDGTTTSPLNIPLQPGGGIQCGAQGLYSSVIAGGGSNCGTAFSYADVNQSGTPSTPIEPASTSTIQVEVKNDVINFWANPSGSWILDKVFAGAAYFIGENDNGNSGASKTISFEDQANQKLTLNNNCVLTFTDPPSARSTLIRFVQDGTGGWDITLPSGVLGSVTLNSGVTEQTIVNFYFDGTNYHV